MRGGGSREDSVERIMVMMAKLKCMVLMIWMSQFFDTCTLAVRV